MARKQLYLHKRGGVYQLRVRVPDSLRPHVGKTEIWKSLSTGDLKEAQERARLERVKIDSEWLALRRQIAPQPMPNLSDADIWRLVARWFVAAERNSTPANDRHAAELDRASLENWDTAAASIQLEAIRVLKEEGITLDNASPTFLRLQQLLHRAAVEHERRQFTRSFPDTLLALDADFRDLTQAKTVQPVSKSVILSAVMQAVENDPTKAKPAAKSLLKRNAHWLIFKQFFGAKTDMRTITRLQVREFMSLLEKLPSNANKHFPGRTVFEAVEMGKRLPKILPGTANTYMLNLGALFRYALNEGMIDGDPSAGLLFQKPKIRAKDKRLPFDTDDLKAIFNAPLYTGCVDDEYRYAKVGPNVFRRGRFWVPLISLYSGMRLNEVCQLTADDFAEQDGVNVILIRNDDDDETKRVKTEAGVRFVPVHSELRKMGLLAFVEGRRKAGGPTTPIFPDLPVGSVGNRADPFSKWFARFLDSVGVKHSKKVFHSFRHSYRDALREADISGEKVRALGGWTTGRTEDNYGSGLRASTLTKDIEAVSYPGLDLTHLHSS